MIAFGKALYVVLIALGVTGLLLWPIAFDNRRDAAAELPTNDSRATLTNTPKEKEPPTQQTADKKVSAKETPAAKAKPKVLTLGDATNLAEKFGKGMAMKAERKDKGGAAFHVDVVGWDGEKRRVELAPDGALKGVRSEAERLLRKGGKKKADEKKGKRMDR